ncbi:MAG: cell envelope integrity protein TolA [Xanthomonadaceae bacterium]|nr:cell envelope integrity protein TolA [Xanthomonadaceae bacterium]MDE2085369.1 cell envelope integrity protein TolA [Xanthomonadaceae bacterium]MDE2257340.1 cell envelope integrity protein TolA [Xanthomonadaceae bacterium]
MESFGDKLRAWVLATLVHLGVVALLFAGLLWTSTTRPLSLPGPVIEAELVGISAAPKPAAQRPSKPAPAKPAAPAPVPPKPPEPKPQPPSQVQNPDRIEREKVAELAQQKADEAKRAEEERHRQEQVLLDQQQRQERERMQQLAQIRREREAADRKAKLEKQKLEQLKDLAKAKPVPAQPVPQAEQAKSGTNGNDDSLQAQYFAAIQNAVTENWLRPDNAQPGLRCMLRIVQIPGGDVIGVQLLNPCNADPLTRASIEQAVKRAAPLPYKGYEKAFQREIDFNFTYDG